MNDNEGVTKEWKCGDQYQHSIEKPKGNEDPWEVLFEDLDKEDRYQCNAWKGEVDNLLVFAGLFSAVVTAFVIETYKTLSSDPNDTIINVLSIIASRLGDNSTISAAPDPFQTKFRPPKTFVRVNIFFFLSLVLSLSAALIGIVCLQWLRQHRSYPDSLSAEQRFGLLHMRTEAFRRWQVPAIFTTLPVLVQAALVLFFIGLVEFVWHIDHTVIVPVGSLIVAILLFLLLTTILPTLQVFPLYNPLVQTNTEVPVECPYRSPQAAAFRRLVTSSTTVFTICSGIFTLAIIPPLLIRKFYRWLRGITRPIFNNIKIRFNRAVGYIFKFIAYQHIYRLAKDKFSVDHAPAFKESFLVKTWAHESWSQFDICWMTIRDTYFRHICGKTSFFYQHKEENINNPDGSMKHYYDAIKGLRKIIMENFTLEDESVIFAAFHCAQALPVSTQKKTDSNGRFDPIKILKTRNHYLSKILRLDNAENQSITHLSDILESPTRELLLDENACIFLNFVKSRDNAGTGNPHTISKTLAEAQLRLVGYLYEKPLSLDSKALQEERLDKPLIIQPRELYFMPEIDDQSQPFIYQWSLVLHSFFNTLVATELGNSGVKNLDVTRTFIAHPIFQSFLSYFCREIWFNPSPRAINKSIETLAHIRNSLQVLLQADEDKWTSKPSHSLFYCASYYFYWLYNENPNFPALMQALDSLHPILKQYKTRLAMPVSSEDPQDIQTIGSRTWISEDGFYPLFSSSWWEFLDEWNLDSRLKIHNDGLNFASEPPPEVMEAIYTAEMLKSMSEKGDNPTNNDTNLPAPDEDIKLGSSVGTSSQDKDLAEDELVGFDPNAETLV